MEPLPEDLDEFYKKLTNTEAYLRKEFKGFDYYVVFSLTKLSNTGEVQSVSSHVTSTTGFTPFLVVKSHVANLIAQAHALIKLYEPALPKPINPVLPKNGDE